MTPAAMTFASGWASGLNAYATALVLGLLGRFLHVAAVPAALQRTDVLIVLGVLTTLEVVADKIPYVDSVWDSVSTIIRPAAGAVLGALIAGQSTLTGQPGTAGTAAMAALGGGTALLSHLTKSSLRLAVNTSPEPITNIATSTAGDIGVVTVASLAALHPVAAAVVAGVVLLVGIVIAVLVISRIRRGYRRLRSWIERRRTPQPTHSRL